MLSQDDPPALPGADALESAYELLNIGDLEQAVAAFTDVIAQQPDAVEAWAGRARAHNRMGRYDEALADSEQVLLLSPGDPDAWMEHGVYLTNLDRDDEALAADQRAAELAPESPTPLFNVVFDLRRLGRDDDAATALLAAAQVAPDDVDVLTAVGRRLTELGRDAEALEVDLRAVQLRPEDPDRHFDVGVDLLRLDRVDEAIEAYAHASSLVPDVAEARHRYLRLLLELGRADQALDVLDALRQDSASPADLLRDKAEILLSLGRAEPGLAALREATELIPDDVDNWNSLAVALSGADRHDEALAAARRTVELAPDAPECRRLVGTELLALGRPAEAAEAFEQAVQLAPDDLEAAAYRFVALTAAGDETGAQDSLDETLTRLTDPGPDEDAEADGADPDAAEQALHWARQALSGALRQVGAVRAGLGDTASAVAAGRAAVALDPGEDQSVELVQWLRQDGRVAEAAVALADAVALAPDSRRLRGELAVQALEEERWADGEQLLRQLLAEEPDDTVTVSKLAFALRVQFRFAEDAALLDEYPQHTGELDFERGSLCLAVGDHPGAEAAFQAVVDEYPDLADGWQALAVARRLRRDVDGALAALDAAEARVPRGAAASLRAQRAWIAYERGDVAGATEQFRQLAADHPKYVEAWQGLVVLLRHQDRREELAAVFDEVAGRWPAEPPELASERAALASERGEYAEAIVIYEAVVAAHPELVDVWQALCSCHRNQRDLDGVAAVLTRAREFSQVEAPALGVERAWLAYERGDIALAAQVFEEVLAAHERTVEAWRGLMICQRVRRDWAAAEQVASRALAVLPDEPQLVLESGWRAYERGDFEAAAEVFTRVTELDELLADGWQALSYTRRALRDPAGALAVLDAAAAARARNAPPGVEPVEAVSLGIERAWLAYERAAYGEAVVILEELLGRTPSSVEAWQALAICHRVSRDFDAAHRALDRAAAAIPAVSQYLMLERVWLSYETGRHARVVEECEQVLAAFPGYAETWLPLVMSLRALRRFDEARAVLDRAAATGPDLPSLRLQAGWIVYDQGDYAAAEQVFARQLELLPRDEDTLLANLDVLRARADYARAQALLADRDEMRSPWVQLQRGGLEFDQRHWPQAEAFFAQMAAETPSVVNAWTYWSAALRRQRRFAEAHEVLARGAEHFPAGEHLLILERGCVHLDERQYAAAERDLLGLLDGPIAMNAYAACLEALRSWGRQTQARELLAGALAAHGEVPALLVERAELAYTAGDYDRALADFTAAYRQQPSSSDAAAGQLNCLRHLDRLAEAAELGRELQRNRPDDLSLRLARALVHTQRGTAEDQAQAVVLAEEVRAATREPQHLAQVSRVLREAGALTRAEELLVPAQRATPDAPELFRELAAVRIWQGRHEEALAALRTCLDLDPYDQPALIWTAVVLRRESRWQSLREHLTDALARRPESHQLLAERGWLHHHDGRYTEALADFTRAGELSDGFVNARLGSSRCLSAMHRYGEAEQLVRAALGTPGSGSLVIELGRILHEQGLDEEALELLRSADPAVQRDADTETVGVLLSLKRFDEAEKLLQGLAKLREPAHKAAYAIFLAEFYGVDAEAEVRRLAREALDISKGRHGAAYGCLGILAHKSGDLRTAEAMYRHALDLDEYSRWRLPLVEVLIRSGRHDEAEEEVEKALTHERSSPEARHRLGLLRLETDRHRDAEVAFRGALRLDPWHVGSICGLATALVAQNRQLDAERELRRAVESLTDVEDDIVRLRLAGVLVQRGDSTGDDYYYRQAAAEVGKVFAKPDRYGWGLRREDVAAEAHYLRGVAYYKVAEASLEPRTASQFRKLALRDLNVLHSKRNDARYPDAQRLRESLRRTFTRAASTALPGYTVTVVCLGLLGLLWYQYFTVPGSVSDTLMATLTPVLLGLSAVSMLYPILAHLKMPGFEADIRQPQLGEIAPSPEAIVNLGTAFLGTSPREIVKQEYGGLGSAAYQSLSEKSGAAHLGDGSVAELGPRVSAAEPNPVLTVPVRISQVEPRER